MRTDKWVSRLVRWIGPLALMLSLVYFVRFAVRNAETLPSLRWDGLAAAGLGVALALYLAVILLSGLAWLILLRGVGEPARFGTALPIFAVAQFGKYIPGNVAHLAGRVVLAVRAGFGQERVLATMALEIAWAVLSGVFVAWAAPTLSGTLGPARDLGAPPTAALAGVTVLALLLPLGARYLLRSLPDRVRRRVPGLSEVRIPGAGPLAACFLLGCLCMLLLGAIPVVLEAAVFGAGESAYFAVAGLFALAWVAGFITPGAPAGLGVRDAILMTGLTPIFGPGNALGVTVVMRLVTSVGDAIAFAAGLLVRRAGRAGAAHPAPL
jgi:hypothetical protein